MFRKKARGTSPPFSPYACDKLLYRSVSVPSLGNVPVICVLSIPPTSLLFARRLKASYLEDLAPAPDLNLKL